MKCGLVYNPNDRKLLASSYSQAYRDMFLALMSKFDNVQHITRSCSAQDIDADVIIFYDVHSTHDITIDGVAQHRAIKIEYFNDPHQIDHDFTRDGITVHKLGSEQRSKRARERGVSKIICPSIAMFDKYIKPHGDFALLYFPVAPKQRIKAFPPLDKRKPLVLANGSIWAGEGDFRPYKFRHWAFKQPCVTLEKKVAVGEQYQVWLAQYAGALALCDTYVCPKYLEIPLSGCLCFAQWQKEYQDLGFQDNVHCIYVTKDNFKTAITEFTHNISAYQEIADNGRKMAENYTAEKFADFVYDKIQL